MRAWGKEVDEIVEKAPASVVARRIPIPGKWTVRVEIPSRQENDYGDATARHVRMAL